MREDYFIQINTVQNIQGQREVLEMTARADLEGEGKDYTITYVDEQGDLAGATTSLHVEDGRCITISRKGQYPTHMIVEKSVRHMSRHDTPYGSFTLGVSALHIQSDMNRNGGVLRFRYCTDVDMVPVGEIAFDISLRRIDASPSMPLS